MTQVKRGVPKNKVENASHSAAEHFSKAYTAALTTLKAEGWPCDDAKPIAERLGEHAARVEYNDWIGEVD